MGEVSSQKIMVDAVYLKKDSLVYYGRIKEIIPTETVSIITLNDEEYIFRMDEVEKIKKEIKKEKIKKEKIKTK